MNKVAVEGLCPPSWSGDILFLPRSSVRLSVSVKSCPLCRPYLKKVQDIFMKLHLNIIQHWTTYRSQEPWLQLQALLEKRSRYLHETSFKHYPTLDDIQITRTMVAVATLGVNVLTITVAVVTLSVHMLIITVAVATHSVPMLTITGAVATLTDNLLTVMLAVATLSVNVLIITIAVATLSVNFFNS